MSFKNRSPTTPQRQPRDLKQRVFSCLNKLADRDTLAVASAELDSIARNITVDSIATFLNCLHSTDSSSRSPVRRQCVSLITLLSRSHGNALSPHLSKMVSILSRRLRDPDSVVRSACVEASAAMSSHVTKPPFTTLSKPLIEMLVAEQDVNSQAGAAMCLAAAIDAAPDPDTEHLRKVLLPKLGKLVRNESFKAKSAVFGVIGSVASVGGAGSKGVLDWLVPCAVDALSSEDWSTRKSAAAALGKLATVEKELTTEYKSACVAALENKRFDKVKIVRETMNYSLDLWKEIPGVCEEASIETGDGRFGCFSSIPKSVDDASFRTPQSKKVVPMSRSPPSYSSIQFTTKKQTSPTSNNRNVDISYFSQSDRTKPSDLKAGKSLFFKAYDNIKNNELGVLESGEVGDSVNSRLETKRELFAKVLDEEVEIFGGLKSGSRVVPYHDKNLDVGEKNIALEVDENPTEVEEISLIREQLAQIEYQQSYLLNLLQKFIGSSQSGINSLETRVNGLELALDEISYDLAVLSERVPNMDSEDKCCNVPGTEFFNPKFWRKTEGRFSTSRLSSSGRMLSLNAAHNIPDKSSRAETYKPAVSQRVQKHQGCGGFLMNPATDACSDITDNSRAFSNGLSKNTIRNVVRVQVDSASGPYGTSLVRCTAPMSLRNIQLKSLFQEPA